MAKVEKKNDVDQKAEKSSKKIIKSSYSKKKKLKEYFKWNCLCSIDI